MWRALLALQTPIAVRAVVFASIGASGRLDENLFTKSSPSVTRPTTNFGREGMRLIHVAATRSADDGDPRGRGEARPHSAAPTS